jgi:protein-S-isoprenylcysteine O-methyltransferase Ste14
MIYNAIIGLCWLAFFAAWAVLAIAFRTSERSRAASPSGRGLRVVLAVAMLVALVLGNGFALPLFGELGAAANAAGAMLCVAGLAFATWARVVLGRNWGMPMTLHANPKLVTSGPYRYVRHPIYTGLTAMWIGTSLVYPFAAVPCAATVAYCVASALREERDMAERFPAAYAEYKHRSKMLIPFLI